MKTIIAVLLVLFFSVNTALAWTYFQKNKAPSYFIQQAPLIKKQLFSNENHQNPYSTFQNPYNLKGSPRRDFDNYSAKIKDYNGKFQGQVSPQVSDPKSITNPYGQYGNPYSPSSAAKPYVPQKWNNPYSTFQNPYNKDSVHNNKKYGIQFHDSYGHSIGAVHQNAPYPHSVNGAYPNAPFKKGSPTNPYDENKIFN